MDNGYPSIGELDAVFCTCGSHLGRHLELKNYAGLSNVANARFLIYINHKSKISIYDTP